MSQSTTTAAFSRGLWRLPALNDTKSGLHEIIKLVDNNPKPLDMSPALFWSTVLQTPADSVTVATVVADLIRYTRSDSLV